MIVNQPLLKNLESKFAMVILILIVIVIKIIVNIIITTSITPPLVHHFFNPPKFDNTHALESSGESFFSPWWKESLMANFWKPTNFCALLLPGLPRMPTAWKTSFPASCGSKNTTSLCQPIPCWERGKHIPSRSQTTFLSRWVDDLILPQLPVWNGSQTLHRWDPFEG